MKNLIVLLINALTLAFCTSTACADHFNVALGKPVTLNRAFPTFEHLCGSPPQAPASTITDGVFLPDSTCWQSGTVYWGPQFSNSIDIDLQGKFELNAAIIQSDNNDAYQLQYRDSQGVYHDWWTVPESCCFGMVTRPNQSDNTEPQLLPTVTATGLRVFGIDNRSDLLFSVSEVQVFCLDCKGVPFKAFTADVKIKLEPESNQQTFELRSKFMTSSESNGIDPPNETVSFQIGSLSITLPAGSFRPVGGNFSFDGIIVGVRLQVKIIEMNGRGFQFIAKGQHANLSGTEIPVTVGISIGDDSGNVTLKNTLLIAGSHPVKSGPPDKDELP